VFFYIAAILAFAILGLLVLLLLFEPGLEYGVEAPRYPLDSNEYLRLLGALADAQVHDQSKVSVLTNGDQYWPAELEAIRSAKRCITIEAYILYEGEISRQIVDALTGARPRRREGEDGDRLDRQLLHARRVLRRDCARPAGAWSGISR
jgi:cardiolipin synthase